MSAQESIEAPDDADEEPTDKAPDSKPEMDADFAASVAEDMAAETADESADDTDSDAPDDIAGSVEGLNLGDEFDIGDDSVSVGDVVANMYTLSANVAAENYGSGEAIFVDESGDLDTSLAEQLQIPEYVNTLAAKHNSAEMTPEQALVLSTVIFFGAVVVMEGEILSGLSEIRKEKNDVTE